MRRLRYLSAAERNLRDLFRYLTIETGDKAYSRSVADRIRQQCVKLASLPGTLGRARPEISHDIRSFPFRGYVIFFRYEETEFVVVNILHGHKDVIAELFHDDDASADG